MNYDCLIIKTDVNASMFEQIRKQASTPASSMLYLIISTPGGIPMFAYRAMCYLRALYKKIIFIVFDEAMSAGTLMALGANEIYLDNGACLGPLDLQIQHPKDDSTISTLDVRDTATSTVFEASNTMLKICGKNLKAGLPMTTAIDTAVKLTSSLYKPIMDKIDPFHLHESYRNAELSTSYGTSLLLQGMITDPAKAAQISTHLANDYSYHGYAIMQTEAKEMGLKIAEPQKVFIADDYHIIKDNYEKIPYGNIVFIPAPPKDVSSNTPKTKKDK